MSLEYYLLIAFFVADILDGWSTYFGIKTGRLRELNPIFRFLFERIGVLRALFLVKLVVALILVWAVYAYPHSSLLQIPLWILAVSRSLVAGNNIRLIIKSSKSSRDGDSLEQ